MIYSLLIFAGCEKRPLDFRNKYIGDYSFTIYSSWFNLATGTGDTTFTSDGNISYGSAENTLQITLYNSCVVEYYVYEDGSISFYQYKGGNSCPQSGIGEFESAKNIRFYWSRNCHGGGGEYDITGVKK